MKFSLVGVLAAVTLLVCAGSASAINYCVGPSALCIPANTYPMTATGMQDAIDDASSVVNSAGLDHVFVAAGTIELGGATIDIDAPTGEDITIEGAGAGRTVFHSTIPDLKAINLSAVSADVSFSDATVQVDGVQTGTRRAVVSNAAELDRIKFDITSSGGSTTEGLEGGGVCRDCEFALTGNNSEAGYALGNMTIHRSEIYSLGDPAGTSGFREGGGGVLQIFNSTISRVARGMSTDNGTLVLTDSVIDMGEIPGARGMVADNPNNGTQAIGTYTYNATIVGTGDNQRSVIGDANAGQSLNLYLRDSILMATAASSKDIVCTSAGSANLTINFDLYFASHFTFDPNCSTTTAGANNADGYALSDIFVNPGGGDFRLKKPVGPATNPAFDSGNTGTICDQAYDLLGNPRCVNSVTLISQDGKIDVGAVEYQNYRPDLPALTAPAAGLVGETLVFSSEGFDANGDAITYKWSFGDGQIGEGSAIGHVYSGPGTYTVKVKTDDGVSQSDEASATVTIAALPVQETPVDPLSFTLSKASGKFKFKRGAKLFNGFKLTAKKPKAAYFLTSASTSVSGTLKLYNAKGKALKGAQKLTVKAGKSYLTFGGKWNRKALAKGKYTVKFSSSSLKDAPKAVLNVVR